MTAAHLLTIPHLTRAELARFFSKVQRDPATGCWNWTGAKAVGYGIFWLRGRNESAHRVTFAWLVEPLQRGLGNGILQLDHIVCDNPACCNPAHLRLVPGVENLRRTGSVSAVNRVKTHCLNGHPLPAEPNRPGGYGRFCHPCSLQRSKDYYRLKGKAKAAALRRAVTT